MDMPPLSFVLFGIVALILILFISKSIRDEGFYATSPGTMDQLQSTRAPPTVEDDDGQQVVATGREAEHAIQKNLMERDVMSMTEGPDMAADADGSYAAA